MALLVATVSVVAPQISDFRRGYVSDSEVRQVDALSEIYGSLKSVLAEYDVDVGSYPSTLEDLLRKPHNAKNWHGPYLDPAVLPVDPWQNPYLYMYPGKHNPTRYDLWSAGPDGKSGTDDDIGNWQQ